MLARRLLNSFLHPFIVFTQGAVVAGTHPNFILPLVCTPSVFNYQSGDDLTDLITVITDATGTALDLTNVTTVSLFLHPFDFTMPQSADLKPMTAEKNSAIVSTLNPMGWQVRYTLTETDLSIPTELESNIHIVFSDSKHVTAPTESAITIYVILNSV